MADLRDQIRAALLSKSRISRQDVITWWEQATDVGCLAMLYRLTDEAHHRIDPPLEMGDTCRLIRQYLLECIRLDPDDEDALSRYEAGRLLEAWFDHLADDPQAAPVELERTARAVTDLYLGGAPEVRLAIETAFLEHILEQERLRPFFLHWAKDGRLREAWDASMAWGLAHPNFMSGLRARNDPRKQDAT